MTPSERNHLDELAADARANLVVGSLPAGVASWGAFDHGTRTAYVGNHRRAYIVALHELGHGIVGKSERRAWAWARTHSAREWTADEHTFAARCLASYEA